MNTTIPDQIADGRTDLIFDYLAQDHIASSIGNDGLSLMQWAAYYGDVSAIKFLLREGAPLTSMGDNLDLNGAAFHGHWRLCQFLMEEGADPNFPLPATGETPLHAALCKADSAAHLGVINVLLSAGADPKAATLNGMETGSFMRDCRTKGETPLHRAAAFGTGECIQLLLDAGADKSAKDMNGDSPPAWASWYLRPASVLGKLCYGNFRIHPEYAGMEANLLGKPHG